MPSTYAEEAIIYRLKSDSSLVADVQDRIHFVSAPSGTATPHITLQMIASDLTPWIMCEDRAGQPRMQIDIWTTDAVEALRIGTNVVNRLQHYNGSIDGIQFDFIKCHGVMVMRDDAYNDLFHGIVEIDVKYITP